MTTKTTDSKGRLTLGERFSNQWRTSSFKA
jgi:hypothetical protein